jgi:hypothetical protein
MNVEVEENYDPNSNVCVNQSDFNVAFRKAIKHNNKENMKKAKPWVYVYLVLWLIFFIWAIMLAMQVPAGPQRTMHIVFAVVAAPAYVLAHYLGALGGSKQSLGAMNFKY